MQAVEENGKDRHSSCGDGDLGKAVGRGGLGEEFDSKLAASKCMGIGGFTHFFGKVVSV